MTSLRNVGDGKFSMGKSVSYRGQPEPAITPVAPYVLRALAERRSTASTSAVTRTRRPSPMPGGWRQRMPERRSRSRTVVTTAPRPTVSLTALLLSSVPRTWG
jgi:hypothetical protein